MAVLCRRRPTACCGRRWGPVRLTVIELVAVLLRTGSEAAERAIMASSAVQEVLQVFLRFPFNSIPASPGEPLSPSMASHAFSSAKLDVISVHGSVSSVSGSCRYA